MYKRNLFAVVAIMLFFAFVFGGCGGGGGSISDTSTEIETPAPTRTVWEDDTTIDLRSAQAGFDFDRDGKMDFLDFDGVAQYHLGENTKAFGLSSDASYKDASQAKMAVPSMAWLQKLHPRDENPNIFQVYLEKGKEYTFEFSINLTEPIAGIVPEIQIFDPENAALPFYQASALIPEITPIPAENPSLICYTFTPEVSGYYVVVARSQQNSVDAYIKAEGLSDDEVINAEVANTESVIFVYHEVRNEYGEPGYYTRFKFSDVNGETTDSVGIKDIIELRKIFIDLAETYFGEMYGQGLEDDEYGTSNNNVEFVFDDIASEDRNLYLRYLNGVQYDLGLVDYDKVAAEEAYENAIKKLLESDDFEALISNICSYDSVSNSESLDISSISTMSDDGYYYLTSMSGDEYASSPEKALQAYLEQYVYDKSSSSGYAPDYSDLNFGLSSSDSTVYTTSKVLRKTARRANLSDASPDTSRSEIAATVSGIPYEQTYLLGASLSAVTHRSPRGGVRVSYIEEKFREKKDEFAKYPLRTKSWIQWISTHEDTKKHSEVSVEGGFGLSKQASGTINLSTSTSRNYQYGLTSMTLVIHYELVEDQYRLLDPSEYDDIAYQNKLVRWAGRLHPDRFRQEFGDYFVAGYQYGACFEASIAITTDTMEQLDEVKTGLKFSGAFSGVTLSADVTNKMKDVFSKANARIEIAVMETGLDFKAPTSMDIKNSRDVKGLDEVLSSYTKFQDNVKANIGDHSNFVPIRVQLMRWRSLTPICTAILGGPYGNTPAGTGTIPITWDQKADAEALNGAIARMRAYYNASEAARQQSPASINLDLGASFDKMVGKVVAAGEDFFTTVDASGDRLSQMLPQIKEISSNCKDLTDRYVFYSQLIQAQKKEKMVTQDLRRQLSKWADDTSAASDRLKIVNKCPFGAEGTSSSGFSSFPNSPTVTADFQACEKNPTKVFDSNIGKQWGCHERQYTIIRTAGGTPRLAWFQGQRASTNLPGLTSDWLPDVGDAYIEATPKVSKDVDGKEVRAVFTFVQVSSTSIHSTYDRRRFIMGDLAVGRPSVGFNFLTSYESDAIWNIKGTAIRLRDKDYPFSGLE